MNPPLERGDGVWITRDDGREIVAVVRIASPNGRALMLLFDAIIGRWMREMPVLELEDGRWEALDGMPVTLRRAAPGMKWTLPEDVA